MSTIWYHLVKAIDGLQVYFGENKLIVIFFATLILLGFVFKGEINKVQSNLFSYSMIMALLLLFPLTAMVVLIYQTAFYDYVWAWSLVPVTAVTAYGLLVFAKSNLQKKKSILIFIVSAMLLCLCGNQGKLLTVSQDEALVREEITEVIEEIYALEEMTEYVIWAPKNVMQEIRRRDGNLVLVYGRDMWDAKSGAYDYESYSEEITNAYNWMEKTNEYGVFARSLEEPARSFQFLMEQYELDKDITEVITSILNEGANTIIFPHIAAEYLEQKFVEIVEKEQLHFEKTYTEDYTIYLVK